MGIPSRLDHRDCSRRADTVGRGRGDVALFRAFCLDGGSRHFSNFSRNEGCASFKGAAGERCGHCRHPKNRHDANRVRDRQSLSANAHRIALPIGRRFRHLSAPDHCKEPVGTAGVDVKLPLRIAANGGRGSVLPPTCAACRRRPSRRVRLSVCYASEHSYNSSVRVPRVVSLPPRAPSPSRRRRHFAPCRPTARRRRRPPVADFRR